MEPLRGLGAVPSGLLPAARAARSVSAGRGLAAPALGLDLALSFASSPALAQAGEPAAGEALFEEALRDAERGDHPAACEKFRRSQALRPATGTLFNVGACEARLGRFASALAAFEALATQLPEGHPRLPEIRRRIGDLQVRAPRLVVRLAEGAPAGTRLALDGRPLAPARVGSAMRLDPGRHAIEATAGRTSRIFEFELAAGESRALEVAPPGEGAEPEAGPDARRVAGVAALGLGAIGLGVGVMAGVLVLDRKATVEELCPGEQRACPSREGVAASDAGRTLSSVSTAGFVLGAVGLGAGAWLLLTAPDPSGRGPRGTLAVSTGLGPRGAALLARGTF